MIANYLTIINSSTKWFQTWYSRCIRTKLYSISTEPPIFCHLNGWAYIVEMLIKAHTGADWKYIQENCSCYWLNTSWRYSSLPILGGMNFQSCISTHMIRFFNLFFPFSAKDWIPGAVWCLALGGYKITPWFFVLFIGKLGAHLSYNRMIIY